MKKQGLKTLGNARIKVVNIIFIFPLVSTVYSYIIT